jgi:formylglycine-generating enzyme required for sulfatase activity
MMCYLSTVFLLFAPVLASEGVYPLWDGHESVADYAKRVNLPPTKTLDLGGGVKMDLVLIPAGKFIMGTSEPTPMDEAGFQKQILIGQAGLAVSVIAVLVMLAVVIVRAVRKRRHLQLSLALLLLFTVASGGCVLSGLHWRRSSRELDTARSEYVAAKTQFDEERQAEKPAHSVTLTKPFYMGKFVVTQEQYQQLVGMNPSRFKGKDNPIEMVSWDDAQAFCKKLNDLTHQAARLPTEAEWEYSCRAGTTTAYYFGDNEADLDRVAWHYWNSKKMTHPVGQKEPNAFGLYDMHGNVWQWCEDRFRKDYYGKSETENPKGPSEGAYRLLRGGSWRYDTVYCRSASRFPNSAGNRGDYYGFRVVLTVSGAE